MQTALSFIKTHIWVGLIMLSSLLLSIGDRYQGDKYWETKDGLDVINSGITYTNSWGWIGVGDKWTPNSWLWDFLMGAGYKLIGEGWWMILCGILVVTIQVLLWRILAYIPSQQYRFPVFILLILGMQYWLTIRAQLIDYSILLGFILVVLQSRNWGGKAQAYRNPILLGIAFIGIVIWQNFHLTALIGVLCFSVIIFFLNSGIHLIKRFLLSGITLIVSASGLFCTPYGWDAVAKPFVTATASTKLFAEWTGILSFPITSSSFATFLPELLIGIIAILFALWNKQWWIAIATAIIGVEAFNVTRFLPFFVLMGVFAYTQAWKPIKEIKFSFPNWAMIIGKILIALIAILNISLFSFNMTSKSLNSDPHDFDSIPQNSRVLATSYLCSAIRLDRPDLTCPTDGRNDFYGSDTWFQWNTYYFLDNTKDQWAEFLTTNKIDAVYTERKNLFDPKDEFLPDYSLWNALKDLGWTEHDSNYRGEVWLPPVTKIQ